MKKLYFLFFITTVLFACLAEAQIKKGATFLGGDIGGSSQTTKRNDSIVSKVKGIIISPAFGKAIRDNLIFGADAVINIWENNYGPSVGQRSYGLGVFLRKYRALGKSGFYLFLQGRFGVSYLNEELNYSIINHEEANRITVGVSTYPGISYAINKKLQLETGFNNLLTLHYFREKREYSGAPDVVEKTRGISINTSLNNLSSLYVGFRLLLNK